MFQTTHDINLKLVYQDNFVFKPSKESVEITLFKYKQKTYIYIIYI